MMATSSDHQIQEQIGNQPLMKTLLINHQKLQGQSSRKVIPFCFIRQKKLGIGQKTDKTIPQSPQLELFEGGLQRQLCFIGCKRHFGTISRVVLRIFTRTINGVSQKSPGWLSQENLRKKYILMPVYQHKSPSPAQEHASTELFFKVKYKFNPLLNLKSYFAYLLLYQHQIVKVYKPRQEIGLFKK